MKPELAVSLGDPAGIGPEIVVRAAAASAVERACRLVVYGDLQVLRSAGYRARTSGAIAEVRQVGRARAKGAGFKPGVAAGRAAFAYLDSAARAVFAGEHDGLVTAPINKMWMQRAGHEHDGHTGYLSELTGAHATMMLAGRRLRVVLATTHIAHRDVSKRLSTSAITRAAVAAVEHLKRFHGIDSPRLAVAALNPHAGEGGLFGDEEERIIVPAVRALARRKIIVEGPLPADTLFATAAARHYDAVVCMYHDQALIPLKLLEFGRSVNVSMGLPFVRTSPDHGTAYAIAGSGRADEGSMVAAILAAARMVRRAGGRRSR